MRIEPGLLGIASDGTEIYSDCMSALVQIRIGEAPAEMAAGRKSKVCSRRSVSCPF